MGMLLVFGQKETEIIEFLSLCNLWCVFTKFLVDKYSKNRQISIDSNLLRVIFIGGTGIWNFKSGFELCCNSYKDAIEAPPETLQILLADALSVGPNMAINCAIFALIGLLVQITLYVSYVLWTYHSRNSSTQ